MKSWIDKLAEKLQYGTPACGAACGITAALTVILMLIFGFWKGLLVIVVGLLFAFIGGVKNKTAWLKDTINRLIPDKDE